MADIIQLRRDTTTNWASVNPVLAEGEIGFNTTLLRWKIGDGVTAWNSLSYVSITGDQGVTGVQGLGVTGLIGATGLNGSQGQTGAQGQGVTGLIGATGLSGTQGSTGVAGLGTTGLIGTTGLSGLTGSQGETGSGIQGVTGQTGLQGSTGIRGLTGAQGVTGAVTQGTTGLPGQTGIVGSTGVAGLGTTGLQGATGLIGATGVGGGISSPLSIELDLGENTGLKLDDALSEDGRYSGITEAGTAGAALAFGEIVYLQTADSRWEKASADNAATGFNFKIGMVVLAAAGDGSATKVLLMGKIRADSSFPTLTIGAPVYMGLTAGTIQTAVPTATTDAVRIIGYGNTADELYFHPSNDYVELV